MEKRDLYDENKKLTEETIIKGEKVPKGRYYITVVIWIQNEDGKFLIQKRVEKKMENGQPLGDTLFRDKLANKELLQK